MAAMVCLLGCQGGEQAASVQERTTTVALTPEPLEMPLSTEEKLERWIRSCDVRQLIITHEGVVHVTFRGRETVRVRLDEAAADRIAATAFGQGCEKRIVVGIE